MKNNKAQWIDEVLQSAKEIGSIESNPYLATRIEVKLLQKPVAQIPARWVYATVAVITIMLFINISVWRTAGSSMKQNTAVRQLVQEYGWASHDLYSNNSN